MIDLTFSNSRNLTDKVYRSGTEELVLYKVGPQTIRNNQFDKMMELNYKLFNNTQGLETKSTDYSKPPTIRKKSMNKQESKNSMLFNIVPSHTVSVDSSATLYKKKTRRSKLVNKCN